MSDNEPDGHYNPTVRLCEVGRSASGSCGFHLTRSKWDPYPWVSAVDADTEAAAAGLAPGDCVLEVNGEDIIGEKIGEVATKVRAKGDKVTLLLWNAGADPQCHPEMLDEIARVNKEVQDLEDALRNKTEALKLAETRLENRMFRGGPELVQDDAQNGLAREVLQLRQTRQALMDKITAAKTLYNQLEDHLVRIDTDLDNKQHSLMTDLRCVDIRERLLTIKTGKSTCEEGSISRLYQKDTRFPLTRMVQEIPKSLYIT